ncbi:MAG TPA: ABC transporter substrate-binding protein [Candidatus Binatia bacterium]
MARFASLMYSIVCLLAFSTTDVRSAERGREQPHTIRIAYVSPVTTMAPIWIATEIGAYQREGLDAKILYIDAKIAVAALVAGEVDAVVISAPSVIPPVLSGANITFIAGLHNKMIFSFHAQPDIQTPAELRGKIVGTNRPGTPADYGTRVAMAKMGLKLTDVQLMPLGSSGVMWSALQSRQVAGVTLAPPYSFRADATKFSRLVDTYDKPYQNTGVVVRRDRIHPLADTWLRLLRALRQANLRWYEDPKMAMFVLMKYTQQSDRDVLQKTYDFETNPPGFTKDLKVSDSGLQGILDFLASTVRPEAAKATPKEFYDTTILDRLEK